MTLPTQKQATDTTVTTRRVRRLNEWRYDWLPEAVPDVTLISFGYLHAPAPTADLVLDVRRYLHDPASARTILDLDGRDWRVQDVVLATPGAEQTVQHLTRFALDFPASYGGVIAVGCAGGRHRSVALVEAVAEFLAEAGRRVCVRHLHVHLPRVLHADGAK